MNPTKQTVEARGVSVTFGTSQVLKNLTFQARTGSFVSIVGKSGSGKTTLLHALAGFLKCSGDIVRPPEFGIVFQSHSVYPWLTVEQNLSLAAWNLTPTERQGRVTEALNIIRLAEKSKSYPGELSGGQIQRVALARALVPRPDLVLLDEPLGQLDLFTRDRMQDWLQELWRLSGATFVLVTHNIEEAVFLSDTVYILRDGVLSDPYVIDFERPRGHSVKNTREFLDCKEKLIQLLENDRE